MQILYFNNGSILATGDIKYLALQYKLGKIDKSYLDNLVSIGKITEQEKDIIMGE